MQQGLISLWLTIFLFRQSGRRFHLRAFLLYIGISDRCHEIVSPGKGGDIIDLYGFMVFIFMKAFDEIIDLCFQSAQVRIRACVVSCFVRHVIKFKG